MERKTIEPGAQASVTWLVSAADLAHAIAVDPSDAFPGVLATARMIALMEVAASRVLRPFLAEGELSVGVKVEVSHSAATPPGADVRAMARFLRQEGKVYVFECGLWTMAERSVVASTNGQSSHQIGWSTEQYAGVRQLITRDDLVP